MNIFIGADHRGFEFKNQLTLWLETQGYSVTDCGNDHLDPTDDYPVISFAVAEQVALDVEYRGILICGSSVGVTIAANKVRGIRAAAGQTVEQVTHGREHDNINVLTIAANYQSLPEAQLLITAFLQNTFKAEEERHVRRLQQITAYESQ